MLQKKLLINELNSGKEFDVYVDNHLLQFKNKALIINKCMITDINAIIKMIDDLIEENDAVWITINEKKFLL